jgi:hypothetical protein
MQRRIRGILARK